MIEDFFYVQMFLFSLLVDPGFILNVITFKVAAYIFIFTSTS